MVDKWWSTCFENLKQLHDVTLVSTGKNMNKLEGGLYTPNESLVMGLKEHFQIKRNQNTSRIQPSLHTLYMYLATNPYM